MRNIIKKIRGSFTAGDIIGIGIVILLWSAIILSCSHYVAPALKPDTSAVRVVGKIVAGAPPAFEPGEDAKGSYFIVTPAYVLYLGWLQQENRELALANERLQAIINKK
jgi:hypothetical protein